MTAKEQAWLRLHLTEGLGRAGLLRLIKAFGSPEAALEADPAAWKQAGIRTAVAQALPRPDSRQFLASLETLSRLNVRLLSLWDEDRYPALLRTIYDPPALLYLRGSLPEEAGLAVVGARQATPAGRSFTKQLCGRLAARGLAIVSGLARGIDRAAHEGALAGDGPTVAVLGCGIDRIYPAEHEPLLQAILAQNGAVLSEYPPGTPPLPGHFPGRNRIISGLCHGVLVVEAAARSGSLLTAEFALEQGREVFAVPGMPGSSTSQGTNRLLKDGAHLVTECADILDVLAPLSTLCPPRSAADPVDAEFSGPALNVYRALQDTPLHVDDLAGKCGLTPMEVSAILLDLELADGAIQLPGMRFVRKPRP